MPPRRAPGAKLTENHEHSDKARSDEARTHSACPKPKVACSPLIRDLIDFIPHHVSSCYAIGNGEIHVTC